MSLQAYKPTSLQAYKPTSLQDYKTSISFYFEPSRKIGGLK